MIGREGPQPSDIKGTPMKASLPHALFERPLEFLRKRPDVCAPGGPKPEARKIEPLLGEGASDLALSLLEIFALAIAFIVSCIVTWASVFVCILLIWLLGWVFR